MAYEKEDVTRYKILQSIPFSIVKNVEKRNIAEPTCAILNVIYGGKWNGPESCLAYVTLLERLGFPLLSREYFAVQQKHGLK